MKYRFPLPRAPKTPKRTPDLTLTEADENWLVTNRAEKRKQAKPASPTPPK